MKKMMRDGDSDEKMMRDGDSDDENDWSSGWVDERESDDKSDVIYVLSKSLTYALPPSFPPPSLPPSLPSFLFHLHTPSLTISQISLSALLSASTASLEEVTVTALRTWDNKSFYSVKWSEGD